MVRDAWQTSECDNENLISYLMTMRERFEQMSEVVKENMEKAQQLQKKWCDQNARQREFQPGDQVLLYYCQQPLPSCLPSGKGHTK